jgi:hypothetical protein
MSNAPVAAISGGAISMAADGSGNHALTLTGTDFVPNSAVKWNGASLMTTYVSPWQISAVVTASNFITQPVTVKVENPAGISSGLELNTISTPIVVAISPEAASVQTGATQQFTATVTGSSSTAIRWSVNGAAGGNSTVGTISSSGLYTAPASVPDPSTFTVTATSVANPSETASASVIVATAIFNLTLSTTGSGSGTITPNPAGTSCGTNCYAYVPGTVVQVTESASAGSMFGAWGGACANKSTCAVIMNSSQSVTVTFNRIYNLTLNMTGTGSGTITPNPVGTSCGTNCYAYVSGTIVQLTASSNTDSTFAGWSGACTGTGACTVTMSSSQTVAAAFNQIYDLTLSVTGSGSGTITPSPAGTSCGTNCHAYASGTVVHVTESANAGSTFAGWGGACSGTGSCSVTMNSSQSATATFNLTGSGGNQVWILDFGPDPVVAGREEVAQVLVTAFTNSGTFSETSSSPGVYMYDPTGTCSYRLSIGGVVSHNGSYDSWTISGVTGAGCGMSTLGSGSGTANGSFPNATIVNGTLTLTTPSPLGTTSNTGNWTGCIDGSLAQGCS